MLYYIISYHLVLYYHISVFYYIILYCIVLYYIILYYVYIIFHCSIVINKYAHHIHIPVHACTCISAHTVVSTFVCMHVCMFAGISMSAARPQPLSQIEQIVFVSPKLEACGGSRKHWSLVSSERVDEGYWGTVQNKKDRCGDSLRRCWVVGSLVSCFLSCVVTICINNLASSMNGPGSSTLAS